MSGAQTSMSGRDPFTSGRESFTSEREPFTSGRQTSMSGHVPFTSEREPDRAKRCDPAAFDLPLLPLLRSHRLDLTHEAFLRHAAVLLRKPCELPLRLDEAVHEFVGAIDVADEVQ